MVAIGNQILALYFLNHVDSKQEMALTRHLSITGLDVLRPIHVDAQAVH